MELTTMQLMNNDSWQAVEGWMNPKVCYVLDAWRQCFDKYHRQFSVTIEQSDQHSLEIGVHHGRLLLALEAITPPQASVYAYDLFDRQIFNIDRSGRGDLGAFEKNLYLIAKHPGRVIPITEDSFSIKSCDVLPHRYTLISIDGGHTPEHAIHDLNYASETLHPGGLIVLDDFPNINWLGVVEGTINFLKFHSRRIAPFMVGYNKLFLTTVSEAGYFQKNMIDSLSSGESVVDIKRESFLCNHSIRALQ